jgi:5-methylcytosine-specific restriction protein B
MIGAIDVQHTDPNPSSTTVFTYHLGDHPTPHNFAESTHEMESHPDTTSAGQQPTNLILYGPPGTGKTFATAAEAIRLCGEIVPDNRTDVMETYHRLCGEKRIEFVTFHQSSSYEDFIEGRQPMTDGGDEGGTGFRLETVKGVFRRISERAEQGKTIATGEGASALGNRQVFKMSIGRAGDAIDDQIFEVAVDEGCTLIGWEDMDFSDPRFADIHEIHKQCRDHGIREGEATLQSGQVSQMHMFRNQVKVGDILVVSKGNSTFRAIGEVTGEYSYEPTPGVRYSHRRAVRWIWVDRAGVPVSEIYGGQFTQRSIYRLSNDKLNAAAVERFLNVSVSSVDTTSQQFVLIIDEINRANISKVFGELITLIEADKRLRQPNALKVRLPYSGAEFGVPDNLHIIGTMNTADRSIALLDTALRRRFDFREMPPEPDTLKDAGQRCGLDLVALLTELNERIEYLYDRDHLIGHAYFINCQSRQHVDAVMRDKIIPLLAEYFFEDWSKIAAVLGDAPKDDGAFDGGFLRRRALKVPPGMEDSGDWMPRFRWSVKSGPFSYEGIVGQ